MNKKRADMKEEKKKIDRRVARTNQCLREALLFLMKYTSYEDIGVQDIAKQADIHRVTFYYHYKDKDELLNEIIDNVLTDMMETMRLAAEGGIIRYEKGHCSFTLLALFEVIQKNESFFRTMYSNNRVPGFFGKMFDALNYYFCQGILISKDIKYTPIQEEIYSHYIASAILGVVEHWLSTNMKYSPNYMAEVLTDIINKVPQKVIYHY